MSNFVKNPDISFENKPFLQIKFKLGHSLVLSESSGSSQCNFNSARRMSPTSIILKNSKAEFSNLPFSAKNNQKSANFQFKVKCF